MSRLSTNADLLDYVSEGVFIVAADFNIIFWNRTLEIYSGILRENVIERNVFDVFPHLNKPFYKQKINEILGGGPPTTFSSQFHNYIIPCIMPDGNYRTQNTMVVGKRDSESDQYMAIFSIKDVTEEAKQIVKYRDMRDTAMQEVNIRKEIEEELRVLNKNKSQLFSIIGHDIKNPLNALIGYSELFLEDYYEIDDNQKLEVVESMKRISQNVIQLLENLLEWSRVQTGSIHFSPEDISISKLVRSVKELFELPAKSKNIELVFNYAEDFVLYADPHMIETVIRNLISNSIKFTPRDGKISLETHLLHDYKMITIRDTGVGMEKDLIEKIFNLEINTSTRGTDNEEGTGLGLVLCKELIEKNGGKIKIDSEPGEGTLVKLLFR